MGGCAFMIYGKLSNERPAVKAGEQSWLKRLFGRNDGQAAISSGPIRQVPVGDLGKDLRRSFRRFLTNRLDVQWEATKTAFEYLDMDHNTYVRADDSQTEGGDEWYLQFMFAGCGGVAETSAELASHWASIWFAEKGEEVSERLLKPFGFIPSGKTDACIADPQFLPIGRLGYAQFTGLRENDSSEDKESSFEIDAALYDALPDEQADELLVQLDTKFSQLFNDGRCRCQLCSPEMDPNQISRPLAEYIN